MPYLKIQSNRELSAEKTQKLLSLASQKLAKELSKPESYVMVELTTNPAMLFAGNDAPAAYVELKSIGLPSALLTSLSKSICRLLNEQLGIEPNRVYIEFIDIKGNYWGWNESTF